MLSLSSLFISGALAADSAASTSTSQSSITSFIPLILIFFIFYFLLIRPQQKKMKEHQSLLNNLKNNDKICTSSGIFGLVKDINDKENIVEVEIAKDVVIKIQKQNIAEVINAEKTKQSVEQHKKLHHKSKKG